MASSSSSLRKIQSHQLLFCVVVMLQSIAASHGWIFRRAGKPRQIGVSALWAHRRIWNAGDLVYINKKAAASGSKDSETSAQTQGVVQEHRGSGWYTVQLVNPIGETISKSYRGTQLSVIPHSKRNDTLAKSVSKNVNASSAVADFSELATVKVRREAKSSWLPSEKSRDAALPPPTMIDLDTAVRSLNTEEDYVQRPLDREYLQQVAHHATFDRWVVFTDLHCSPTTMDATMSTLDVVHQNAVERDAGVLFLGDWWHHRGTLRVDCLNAVLEKLSTWTVPMVMIPGNHDQVTLGGHVHSLTPLEHAYRVRSTTEETGRSFPGPLIFSHPTVFRKALFVPHIRDNAIMECVLRSPASVQAEALFVHADVTGAYMNDQILSMGGVPPYMFPKDKPIYSGHFHKPHFVNQSGVAIEYLGSPYEVSLSEAQQRKSLAVIDASKGWTCVERIPIDVGRKHFRPASIDNFLAIHPKSGTEEDCVEADFFVNPGDRVVFSIDRDEMVAMRRAMDVGDICEVDKHVQKLRSNGVVMELRETKELPVEPMANVDPGIDVDFGWQEMTMESTWRAYLEEEVRRDTMSSEKFEFLHQAGIDFLQEVELEKSYDVVGNGTVLELHHLTVSGFGPFVDEVTYPLCERGMVLLRGKNAGGGADSNGIGKSSLVMSALWAMTGTLDPRPFEDSKVSDVVNDSCKSARVSISGKLNGVDFTIFRTKTSNKGSLIFLLGDKDLSAQSMKETQSRIDEEFGLNQLTLPRTIFHNQHNLNSILEATDSRLKDELSAVVPLNRWKDATAAGRKKVRENSKLMSEIRGKMSIRELDLKQFEEELQTASDNVAETQRILEQTQSDLRTLHMSQTQPIIDLDLLRNTLEAAKKKIEECEETLTRETNNAEAALAPFRDEITKASDEVTRCQARFQKSSDLLQSSVNTLNSAKKAVSNLEARWSIDLSNGMPSTVVTPDICPTCQQTLPPGDENHVEVSLKEEVESCLSEYELAASAEEACNGEIVATQTELSQANEKLAGLQSDLNAESSRYALSLDDLRSKLDAARQEHSIAVDAFSSAVGAAEQGSEEDSVKSEIKDAEKEHQMAEEKLAEKRSQVKRCRDALRELEVELESSKRVESMMEDLVRAFGQFGVQTFILQSAIELLEATTQIFLNELSDGTQKLNFQLDAGDKILRRAMIRDDSGSFNERALASLSGGQWRRCSVALSLGFADMLARRGSFRSNLMIFDEPMTHLDRSGRDSFGKVCRKLLARSHANSGSSLSPSTILVILQDFASEDLDEAFDYTDEVVRSHGATRVLVDD